MKRLVIKDASTHAKASNARYENMSKHNPLLSEPHP